jgi:hypothetical protein
MEYEFLFVDQESSWVEIFSGDSQEQALEQGLNEDYPKYRMLELSNIYGIENNKFKSMKTILFNVAYKDE